MSAPKTRSDEKPVVAIERITIAVGGKKFELTLEEARALKDALNKTFEPTTVFQPARVERIIERERPYTIPPPWKFPPMMWGEGGVTRLDGPTCLAERLETLQKFETASRNSRTLIGEKEG